MLTVIRNELFDRLLFGKDIFESFPEFFRLFFEDMFTHFHEFGSQIEAMILVTPKWSEKVSGFAE